MEKLPFQLQSGEKIIRELKPQFIGFMLQRIWGSYVAIVALLIVIIIAAIFFNLIPQGFVIGVTVIPLLLIAVSLVPYIAYGKSWFWITTRRVVGKRGILGYSIDSIPLENVSDVVLARTLLDRILGLSSLIIVPMGGTSPRDSDSSPAQSAQNSNFFPALKQETARELQRVLFNLRDELKHTQITPPNAGAPSAPSSEAPQQKSNFSRGTT